MTKKTAKSRSLSSHDNPKNKSASRGFAQAEQPKHKRYWVLECRAYQDEEGVDCFEYLAVSSIYIRRCGNTWKEYREACRVMQWTLHRMPPPCNCMFIFTDEITPRPVTWVSHWTRLLALHAKGQAQTGQFEALHEEFAGLKKFDPEKRMVCETAVGEVRS